MKKLVLFLILLCIGIHAVPAQKLITPPKIVVKKTDRKNTRKKPPKPIIPKEDEVFLFVEEPPEFPGGEEALYKYLSENIRYPELAKEVGLTGRVIIRFVVDKDGSIKNAKIVKDIGGDCGKEALRVVKDMPKWKPAKQGGKVVSVEYNIPINFQLR